MGGWVGGWMKTSPLQSTYLEVSVLLEERLLLRHRLEEGVISSSTSSSSSSSSSFWGGEEEDEGGGEGIQGEGERGEGDARNRALEGVRRGGWVGGWVDLVCKWGCGEGEFLGWVGSGGWMSWEGGWMDLFISMAVRARR